MIAAATLAAAVATGLVLAALDRPAPPTARPPGIIHTPGPSPEPRSPGPASSGPISSGPISPGPISSGPASPGSVAPGADPATGPGPAPRRARPHAQVIAPPPARTPGNPPADDPVLIEGALRHPDDRPDGVPEQVEFFFGGGPECYDPEATRPRIEMASKPLIPTEFLLCFLGFRSDRPLQVTVTPPGGRPVAVPPQPDPANFFGWPILPSYRAGGYRVTARQGERHAEAVFTVTRPTTPRLWLDRGSAFLDHSVDLHLYFAGYPPNGTVDFHVYREDHYFSTFRVRADALGGGHAVFRTGGDLPNACWGITSAALRDGPHLNVFCTSEAGRD
ncbi:hypothetical protein AB0M54_20445 [Actinoplanes sp. NPDC051470]|uniref:hypothetical protein n=1 Tax=Actinoplanes sp. NPDC051470 TaxID=3157224 RepID=UPI00342162FC